MKSKKLLSLTLATLFTVSVISVASVSAQTAPTNGPSTSNTNSSANGNSRSTVGNGAAAAQTTTQSSDSQLKDRVAKHKAEFKTTLTSAQQKRMQGRCKNAQTVLGQTIERAKVVQTNRDRIHANLLNKLTALEAKLKAAGADTSQLNTQIADLKTKIDTFKVDTDAYLLAAQDTATLDCQADPVAFKASLEASRAALKKVHNDAVAIRNSLAQNIKPLLVSLKTSLTTEGAN